MARSSYHLTLAFLGEVPDAGLAALTPALREKLEREEGFRAHLAQVGTFPASGPIRVLWAGVEPAVRFARLAELVRDAVGGLELPFDDKLFRSHVTLARCDPPWPARTRGDLAALAPLVVSGESVAGFACERIALFSSDLRQGGPIYRSEAEFVLRS